MKVSLFEQVPTGISPKASRTSTTPSCGAYQVVEPERMTESIVSATPS